MLAVDKAEAKIVFQVYPLCARTGHPTSDAGKSSTKLVLIMNHLTQRMISLCAAFVLLLVWPINTRSQSGLRRDASSRVVLFAVNSLDEKSFFIAPIVIVDRGRYIQPPPGTDLRGDRDPASAQFAASYFKTGRKYRLLSGGAEVGTATVKQRKEIACASLASIVEVETAAKIGGEVRALATDSAAIGRRRRSRRMPTIDERAAVLKLAEQAYRQKKVPAALIKEIKTINLTGSDLDGNGKAEMIGSYVIRDSAIQYSLFIVAEPVGKGFKTAMVWYRRSAKERDQQDRRLVDVVDLDRDGVAEIITVTVYFESADFTIYKKQKGRWRSVYIGGGYGC